MRKQPEQLERGDYAQTPDAHIILVVGNRDGRHVKASKIQPSGLPEQAEYHVELLKEGSGGKAVRGWEVLDEAEAKRRAKLLRGWCVRHSNMGGASLLDTVYEEKRTAELAAENKGGGEFETYEAVACRYEMLNDTKGDRGGDVVTVNRSKALDAIRLRALTKLNYEDCVALGITSRLDDDDIIHGGTVAQERDEYNAQDAG